MQPGLWGAGELPAPMLLLPHLSPQGARGPPLPLSCPEPCTGPSRKGHRKKLVCGCWWGQSQSKAVGTQFPQRHHGGLRGPSFGSAHQSHKLRPHEQLLSASPPPSRTVRGVMPCGPYGHSAGSSLHPPATWAGQKVTWRKSFVHPQSSAPPPPRGQPRCQDLVWGQ